MIRYCSTRDRQIRVSAQAAVLAGLAADGGLFVPETMPAPILPDTLIDCGYRDLARRILKAFLEDYSNEELSAAVSSAYDAKFDAPDIVQLRALSDGWLMELWHSPTCAFKDIALTILPHLMSTAYQDARMDGTICILTATSGDTGKAALAGFADVPHTAITVFYPEVGVSEIQKLQMQTAKGSNVMVYGLAGNFDDCQRLIKEAAGSPRIQEACRHVSMSSANSINIGRLVPQIVYYYKAYLDLVKAGRLSSGQHVNFVVPTGNFGDILAGYLAKRLGLPVGRLICASNSNDVLTEFLRTGRYSIRRPFHATMSPSMDILVSSNLERLLYLESEGDDALVRTLMQKLKDDGEYTISAGLLQKIQETFLAASASEEDCAEEIKRLWEEEHVLIDPHTAVAMHALHESGAAAEGHRPAVVLSTASPYKFSASVLKAITGSAPADGFACMQELNRLTGVPVPPSLAQLKDLPVRFDQTIRIEEGMDVIVRRIRELGHD